MLAGRLTCKIISIQTTTCTPLLAGLLQINKWFSFSVLLSGALGSGGWSCLVNVLPTVIQTVCEVLQSFLPTAFYNPSFCQSCWARYKFKPRFTLSTCFYATNEGVHILRTLLVVCGDVAISLRLPTISRKVPFCRFVHVLATSGEYRGLNLGRKLSKQTSWSVCPCCLWWCAITNT